MEKLFWVAFLILSAISMSKQAGYSNTTEVPAIKPPFACNAVEGKKTWCACRSSISSAVIDLSSLGIGTEEGIGAMIRPPKFKSKNMVQGWHIAWTPCEDFDIFANETLNPDIGEKACKGVGFARYPDKFPRICQGYGSHKTAATFYSNGHDSKTGIENFYIEFHFSSKDGEVRNAKIWLECTPDSEKNYLEYERDKSGIQIAKFYSKCCCPNQKCMKNPPTTSPHKYNLNGGEIAGISVGVVAFVVIIAIVVVYKRRNRIGQPIQVVAQENDERNYLLRM